MNIRALPIFLVLLSFGIGGEKCFGQELVSISGKITDIETGEKLSGVTVFERTTGKGTVSNSLGEYSFQLPQGSYRIQFQYLGYSDESIRIRLNQNLRLPIEMQKNTTQIEAVTVQAERADHNITSTEISVEKLTMKQVERIPVIMGEMDIMKTIQLLPGITSIAEGRSGYIVRGSGIDQNLILMDGMPVYYSSHMQGLYSVFNADAVSGLTVYKGGIPAHF